MSERSRAPDAGRQVEIASLVDVLLRRAAEQPNDPAYIYLPDRGGERISLSFAELYGRSRALALFLAERVQKGDRAALLFLPGLDFIVAFFGCLIAGVIAVPLMMPRRDGSRDASAAILANCSPRFAMTRRDLIEGARPDLADCFRNAEIEWLFVDDFKAGSGILDRALSRPAPDDVALLQYTSGSTSAPKGVIVDHGNLVDNSEMIRIAFGNTRRSTYVSWVPLYHDMGLVLNALQSLYVGSLCVLLSPASFLQRPLGWLRAIHEYRAEVAGGPNFAFDLCVRRHRADQLQGIDLSCWKVAFNGAEPIRADTIDQFAATFAPYGFDAKSAQPAYGMAEATLLISTGRRGAGPVKRTLSRVSLQRNLAISPERNGDVHTLVGCGRRLAGEHLAIVEPEKRTRLGPRLIGEIWVTGPNVAKGYWGNPEATEAMFRARLEGEDAECCWLRTGDLGFLDGGELYITGRIKDLIIIRGINYYPNDIENTVQDCHPALRPHCGAAFSVPGQNSEEQLVVIQEIERTHRQQIDIGEVLASIREAIAREHDIAAREIVLIRTGSLPQTTSGKVQRNLARQMFLAGCLTRVQ